VVVGFTEQMDVFTRDREIRFEEIGPRAASSESRSRRFVVA
jgi:hypothetical protein